MRGDGERDLPSNIITVFVRNNYDHIEKRKTKRKRKSSCIDIELLVVRVATPSLILHQSKLKQFTWKP